MKGEGEVTGKERRQERGRGEEKNEKKDRTEKGK